MFLFNLLWLIVLLQSFLGFAYLLVRLAPLVMNTVVINYLFTLNLLSQMYLSLVSYSVASSKLLLKI
jgi:hypothetical protein